MDRTSFAEMECPIARAADEVADGWSVLILREAYKGATTFGEFQAGLPIASTTLTRKLESLRARGYFSRTIYQTRPQRERYELTAKALDLLPVLLALAAWGNRWLAPDGAILDVVDAESGRTLDVTVVDRKTSEAVIAGRVELKPGRGATDELRKRLKAPMVLGANSAGRLRRN